ncbi:Uncharacterised protein [Bordetella pertussis]|nr:Uncharacterised protein [Bordetella pertussis]
MRLACAVVRSSARPMRLPPHHPRPRNSRIRPPVIRTMRWRSCCRSPSSSSAGAVNSRRMSTLSKPSKGSMTPSHSCPATSYETGRPSRAIRRRSDKGSTPRSSSGRRCVSPAARALAVRTRGSR